MDTVVGLAALFVWFGAPILLCGKICEDRKRSTAKGIVVGLLTGWLGVLLLWLGLKRRNPETMALY